MLQLEIINDRKKKITGHIVATILARLMIVTKAAAIDGRIGDGLFLILANGPG